MRVSHCQKLLLTSRHNQTSCYPVSSMWWRHCQRSCRSLFLAALIMHNRKSPPQSTWSIFTKPNGTTLITQQSIVAAVCVGLCSSPYISMCDYVRELTVAVQPSKCYEWTMIQYTKAWRILTSLSLFPSREILRSSLLSSLWSEAAIAIDYSKLVRSTFCNTGKKKAFLETVLFNKALHLWQWPVTKILFVDVQMSMHPQKSTR